MAAHEDQLQPFVTDRAVVKVDLVHGHGQPIALKQPALVLERPLAPQAVDGPVASGCQQPGDRVSRDPLTRPTFGCNHESLLGGFLGEVEIAEEADQ